MEEYPSVLEQIKNASQASAKVIAEVSKGKNVFVSKEVENQRKQICHNCNYYDESQKRCRQCGCPIYTKIRFITERCPLNYWESEKHNFSEEEEISEIKEKVILSHTLGPDTPTPPDNPKEGEIYNFKGFQWQFIDDEWKFVV
jgi:hypothetical protein